MKRHLGAILMLGLCACGGSQPGGSLLVTHGGEAPASAPTTSPAGPADEANEPAEEPNGPADDRSHAGEFVVNPTDASSRPAQATLQATETDAAVRFLVVDKKKGPIQGVVINLTAPSGRAYYAPETDAQGFTEVLLPIGQTYELMFLSLGRHDIAATVKVANEPRLNLKLTLRYEREEYPTGRGLVLQDVRFETGKATLVGDSHARLDTVVEYLTHKPSARIEISGHTDNVGNRAANKKLSQQRANAVRDYLISKGIDAARITAVGYGDERPIAPNDTGEGRQKNRRIEATEL
jgi:outer membrane protein OmpA-like peptidoglycan-associated protein